MSETMRYELAKDMRAALDKVGELVARLRPELIAFHGCVDRWSDAVLEEQNANACARMSRVNGLLTDRSLLSQVSMEELFSDLRMLSNLVGREAVESFRASKGIST